MGLLNRGAASSSKACPAAFCAIAISAVRPCPDASSRRATCSPNTNAAVVQIEHPAGAHAEPVRHAAATTVERHVGHLGVRDQNVDGGDRVLAVSFDQALRGPLHHVDRALVFGDVMPEPGRAKHHVVAQVVGPGEPCVILGADRLAR